MPNNSTERRNIGVFVSQVSRVWGIEFMAGVTEAAEHHNLNLVCFVGGQPVAITTPGQMAPSYGLYDLAHSAHLDGLIWAADLGHGLKTDEITQFRNAFGEIPIVANALDVSGMPNLLTDSVSGMRAVIKHLIETHGYKRLAFITGPREQVEAEQRLFAYKQELSAHDIPFDEKLVITGNYSPESGRAAMRKLMDQRKVRFDAVVASNDKMAFGAIEVLRQRGYHIPRDVAVTGFDDVKEARSLGVPLTTVRQSFYETGRKSVETLLSLLEGRREPTLTMMPTELVVRWSCGCLPQFLTRVQVSKEDVARTGRLENKKEAVIRSLSKACNLPGAHPELEETFGKIWEEFLSALHGEARLDDFLHAIETGVQQLQKYTEDPADWHNILSALRQQALAGITDKDSMLQAENLFQQARMMVGELSQRHQAYKRLELEQQEQVLQAFSFDMAPAMTLQEIGAAVQHHFPAMGIEHLYVMFYEKQNMPESILMPPPSHHHLYLQYQKGKCELFSEQPRLATGTLIPQGSIPDDRRYTAVIMPLSLAQNRFGFMWMEMSARDWEVYSRVRNLLSSALLRVTLVDQREAAQREVERLLEEVRQRAEELDSLYQLEQHRRKDADALSKAARGLSTLLKMDEVPQQILEQLQTVLPYERGSLMMEEMDGTVSVLAHRGFPQDERVNALHVNINRGGVYDQIETSGEAFTIDDVTESEGWIQVEWLPLHYSWMGVPLFSKNKVIGMLSLTRPAKAAFSKDDIVLASTFAMQAAIALQNARLYEEVTRFNELMERMVSQRVEELNNAYVTLEKLDKNKTSFIQVAAHELRTPITVMKGYLGILRAASSVQQNESLLMAVDGVMKGTDRLHQVVNAMLDVAKLESQTIVPRIEMVIPGLILQLVLKEYKNDLKERTVNLVVESSLNQLPPIPADPQLLQKALDAVFINAIKYTPDGGSVTISGAMQEDERHARWAEIRVADTGIGIDPANQKVIFEKLHQVGKVELHSSGRTKFKGGGPGLGLAIAAGIMKAHGGKIWVESPGYDEEKLPGSVFFLRLPMPKE